MANLTGTLKLNLSYQAPGGGTVAVPQKSIALSYEESNEGSGGVPAGSGSGVQIAVPFGTVVAANMLYLVNNTSQVLNLKVNGGSAVVPIAANGGACLVQAALTDATVVTTDAGPSAALERFDYFVFGNSS